MTSYYSREKIIYDKASSYCLNAVSKIGFLVELNVVSLLPSISLLMCDMGPSVQ